MSAMHRLREPSISHWDFPLGITGVALLVRFGADLGVPVDRALAGSGVTEAALTDPATEVEAHQELRVVGNLVDALGATPGLGLLAGRQYHATAFGILGYAFISSRTLADAINLALRYLDLSSTFSIPRATLADGQLRITLDSDALPGDVARFLVERDLAAILTVLYELLPGEIAVAALEVRGGGAVDRYAEFFGVRPRLGAESTTVTFDAALLDRPLPRPTRTHWRCARRSATTWSPGGDTAPGSPPTCGPG
jgi:hypothetical protein